MMRHTSFGAHNDDDDTQPLRPGRRGGGGRAVKNNDRTTTTIDDDDDTPEDGRTDRGRGRAVLLLVVVVPLFQLSTIPRPAPRASPRLKQHREPLQPCGRPDPAGHQRSSEPPGNGSSKKRSCPSWGLSRIPAAIKGSHVLLISFPFAVGNSVRFIATKTPRRPGSCACPAQKPQYVVRPLDLKLERERIA